MIFWTADIGETIVRSTTPSVKVITVITMFLCLTEHVTEDYCCDHDVPLIIAVIMMFLCLTEHVTEDQCCNYDVPLPDRACD